MVRDLTRLLRPRSVAVLGGVWAENVVVQCRKMGFDGPIWPIHPTRAAIGDLPSRPSLADLPQAPDATFIGVNRHATVKVVGQLQAMGAGGAVAFASGWAETGDSNLQSSLVAAARDMAVLGPNCYGVINYLDGALLWPDQHGGKRVETGVAILSQSSNIAINLTMQRRGLPIAFVACLGNAAQVGLAELGAALLDDPRVTALGLYIEGIGDAHAFAAMAETARLAGKGVVALKGGRSAKGALAATSHTAALTGEGLASSSFLAQCGVSEVSTPAELLETLKILHVHGPLRARTFCAVACSGGEAGLISDLAEETALDFPPLDPSAATQLQDLLGPLVTISNPLDYQTFIWGDQPRMTDVFASMLAGYDAGLFVIDPPRPDRCDPASFRPALLAMAAAADRTNRPAIAVASLPENMDEALAEQMVADGQVPLMGLETALAAIQAACAPAPVAGWRPLRVVEDATIRIIDEATAKAQLAKMGLDIPRGASAPTLDALADAALSLTPSFALKGLGFAHKTEAGAVRLNLTTLADQAPMPGVTGYLIEEMVQGAVAEVLIGCRRDPVYGVTLTLGLGGTLAELSADIVTLIAPVTAAQIDAAFRRLRFWPLLNGYRGRATADITSAANAALILQDMLISDPDLVEIEINPLMLRKTGGGAVVADALICRYTRSDVDQR